MNASAAIQKLGFSIQHKPGLAEVEALINLWPEAALLIDRKKGIILLCNSKACEFSFYTRSELIGLPITTLFTNSSNNTESTPDFSILTDHDTRLDLVRQNSSRIPIILKVSSLNTQKPYDLVTVETIADYELRKQQQFRYEQLWNTMQIMSGAALQPDIEKAITLTLNACINLTGASILTIYQARIDSPLFDIKFQIDDQNRLPNQLSSSDVASLHGYSIWEPGKRSTCSVHRLARAANFSYIASIPIGDPKAIIGLLLVAGYTPPDHQYLEGILHVFATYLHSLLQGSTLINQLQHELQDQQKSGYIWSIVQSAIGEGVITLSPKLVISSMNKAAETCLGYSNLEVTDQSIYNILIGSDELAPAFDSALHGRNYQMRVSLKLYRRNGDSFPADLRVLPIIVDGQLQNIVVIFQDLSEQEEYRTRNQLLEQRALLGEVTASFAHEVRNPINNISTGLQLLAYNLPPDDPNQSNIQRLQNDCERLADLVKSSLSFVRPMEYKLELIDFSILLAQTLERWKARLERNNIKHHLQVEDSLPLVEGDIRAIDQVLANLINNAIQAMNGKEGVLALKARRIPGLHVPTQIEISISDTGPGIPQEIRDRIFEPFFTTKQSGTGLGLAIVKRIITAHKGAIHINSVPGGTIVSIVLPAVRDQKSLNGVS